MLVARRVGRLFGVLGIAGALACGEGSASSDAARADGGALVDAAVPRDGAALLDGDSADAATPDAAVPDAATPDAARTDAGSSTTTLGASAIAQHIYLSGPATGVLTTTPVTTTPGSVLLASIARGTWAAETSAPTDDRGNTFTLVDGAHAYAAWPGSRTALYDVIGASGGAGHTFSLAWGDAGGAGDEITISVVEVTGASAIEDVSWVEREAAGTLVSETVTTTGPATLVAWWWGTGGVRPVGDLHVAVPGDGFTIVPGATGLRSLSANGYVQVAVAAREVTSAGTYSVSWTSEEGAQLYLVAVR